MNWWISLIVLFCLAVSTLAAAVASSSPWSSNTENRLPQTIIPSAYRLNISIDLETKFNFNGTVEIDVECKKTTNQIFLHSTKHNITKYSVIDSNTTSELTLKHKQENEERQQIELETTSNLVAGTKYTLKFTFEGFLSSTSTGLYKSEYKTSKKQKMYVCRSYYIFLKLICKKIQVLKR